MAAGNFGWNITSQVADQTIVNDAGLTVVGRLIYYATNDGNKGVVFIANNLINQKHVTETVRADAKLTDEIGRLSENFTQGG